MHATPGPPGVSLAHTGCSAPVDAHPLDRGARETAEAATLAPGATRALGAGSRVRPEAPDPVRTCFERDRDRILHASAFRRLAGKTQVFVFPADHQRTRLTHTLEVAQVAVAIARTLRLNLALTEAIALGHDCGHGPGGHASEEAFGPFVGGYDHAVWGADVVLAPLNLCAETLDGIRNHSWSRPAPATPEGEVVAWADRIAYVCHDFEDAVSAGVVSPADLPAEVHERCGSRRSQQIGAFIDAVIDGTLAGGQVAMTTPLAEALAAFRAFDYERVYLRPASVDQAAQVIRLLRGLVDHLIERGRRRPVRRSGPRRGGTGRRHDRSVRLPARRRLAGMDPARPPSGRRPGPLGPHEGLRRADLRRGGRRPACGRAARRTSPCPR